MTDVLYFDTDCLSAFLWVKAEHLLVSLYSGNIIVPQQVYNELSNPHTPHLKERLNVMIDNNDVLLKTISTNTPEFNLYMKLTNRPEKGRSIIGRGEAAVIALASASSGIIASNNLKDVASYTLELGLRHITTGDIILRAHETSLITENDGNIIWSAMLAKKRKIGAGSFTDYIAMHRHN
ncbi:MAG: hypothetical protein LBD23_04275 [Oscillospiraceae bacterium]|nr:hypothetical protein [Oscillospiraceae bacterium]